MSLIPILFPQSAANCKTSDRCCQYADSTDRQNGPHEIGKARPWMYKLLLIAFVALLFIATMGGQP